MKSGVSNAGVKPTERGNKVELPRPPSYSQGKLFLMSTGPHRLAAVSRNGTPLTLDANGKVIECPVRGSANGMTAGRTSI